MKKKFYVVWSGKKRGVFTTWDACKKSIQGYQGAQYKSFPTNTLAQEAFSSNYEDYKGKSFFKSELSKEQLQRIGKPNLQTVSVDAACSGNPGIVEYQCVDTQTKKQLFHYGPLYESTNNVGEFLGLVHAISFMKKNNDNRPIYTDSRTAMSWVKRKKYNTTLVKTDKNAKSFELMDRAINWLKLNHVTNTIIKWETKAWGEIPADFGRK